MLSAGIGSVALSALFPKIQHEVCSIARLLKQTVISVCMIFCRKLTEYTSYLTCMGFVYLMLECLHENNQLETVSICLHLPWSDWMEPTEHTVSGTKKTKRNMKDELKKQESAYNKVCKQKLFGAS